MYIVLGEEPLVYLNTIIQGRVVDVLACCSAWCVEGRAFDDSYQDYPRLVARLCLRLCNVCWRQSTWCIRQRLSKGVCCCVLIDGSKALGVSNGIIIPGLVAGVIVCSCVLCNRSRALGVSDQDDPRVCAAVYSVLVA